MNLGLVHVNVGRRSIVCRQASAWHAVKKWAQNLNKTDIPRPPYGHICLVGDPVLRCKAQDVDSTKIKGDEIQNVTKRLIQVMHTYQAVGLSAPQIGVPLRILVFEFPEKFLKFFPPEIIRSREIVVFPRRVFINPEVQVVNPHKVIFPEACESIRGFSASVTRYHEVEIAGYNENGERHTWSAKGWPARIIQHEQDHLEGRLYTDIMNSSTFQYDCWHWVNMTRGKYNQSFSK